ncbi:hypothetical protein L1887_51331 [Cichorium endivia]|nr:hypothetical protein L1887_51331 [Cichorium endivia]
MQHAQVAALGHGAQSFLASHEISFGERVIATGVQLAVDVCLEAAESDERGEVAFVKEVVWQARHGRGIVGRRGDDEGPRRAGVGMRGALSWTSRSLIIVGRPESSVATRSRDVAAPPHAGLCRFERWRVERRRDGSTVQTDGVGDADSGAEGLPCRAILAHGTQGEMEDQECLDRGESGEHGHFVRAETVELHGGRVIEAQVLDEAGELVAEKRLVKDGKDAVGVVEKGFEDGVDVAERRKAGQGGAQGKVELL